ncbi:hypothetical protein [Streptomyces sp. NPDC053079]|uniref:hypothetical protein n=1 Tax=Streptomyces sp. NPDC053079 TaxID=3365697 RepID=UPI0037D7497C
MRYRVHLQTVASTAIDVEVPDDVTDPAEIIEAAYEQGEFPTLCHQCSGGLRQRQNLDLGDGWEPVTDNGKPIIDPVD